MVFRGIALVALVTMSVPTCVGSARADAPGDYLGPREIALGDSLRAESRGALAINLNPAGLALSREMVFDGSYGYRTGDGASAVTLSACDSTVPVPGCFYYRYFASFPSIDGSEAKREVHDGGATFARAITPRVAVGIDLSYYDYSTDVMDEEDESGFLVDLGTTVRPNSTIAVALVGYHLLGARSAQYPRSLAAGVSVRPISTLALSIDALWKLDREDGESTGRYGGGAEYFLRTKDKQLGFPLRVGAVHDVGSDGTYVGGGLGLASKSVDIDVGLRRQVRGGDDLVVQLGLRIYGPRLIAGTNRYQ